MVSYYTVPASVTSFVIGNITGVVVCMYTINDQILD